MPIPKGIMIIAWGIRAGTPTIVCAMQGDQPFHGSIAEARGIGKYLGFVGSPTVTADSVATAINDLTADAAIVAAAKDFGEQVQSEGGVAEAISFIGETATSFSYPWQIMTQI